MVTDNFNVSRKRLHICHFSSIFLHRLFFLLSVHYFPLPDQSGSDGELRFGVPFVHLALASRVLLNVLKGLGSGSQNRTHDRVRHLGRKELFFRNWPKLGQEKANWEPWILYEMVIYEMFRRTRSFVNKNKIPGRSCISNFKRVESCIFNYKNCVLEIFKQKRVLYFS